MRSTPVLIRLNFTAVALLVLFLAGLVAGTLNILAGGGSFLTLPILIFSGLPPTMANGTNRLAILAQNSGAAWSFHRGGLLPKRVACEAAVALTLGALVGTPLALQVSDEAFKNVLAVLMVVITLWNLLGKKSMPAANPQPRIPRHHWILWIGIGVYGGFVQAGVGFFVLFATSALGYDLVRGNAIKITAVLAFTILSFALFAHAGQVAYGPGLALSAGTILGGQIGVRLAILKGHQWIRRIVTVAIIVFAIRLLLF